LIVRKQPSLHGNPSATLAEAKAVLKRAEAEARGQGVTLQARQAAEKVWLSASTAADSMTGGAIENSKGVVSTFERAWGAEGREVARDVSVALHRGCFYGGAKECDGSYVMKFATRLGRVLNSPIRDSALRKRVARRG
jgi:hypothetical protein